MSKHTEEHNTTVHPIPGCIGKFFIAGFLIMPLLIMGLQIGIWYNHLSWEEVPATITSVHIKKKGEGYNVIATYKYLFQKANYQNDSVYKHTLNGHMGKSASSMHRELKKYHKSQQPFRCYVNSSSPKESILYRHFPWDQFLPIFAFFSIFVIVCLTAKKIGRAMKEKGERALKKKENPIVYDSPNLNELQKNGIDIDLTDKKISFRFPKDLAIDSAVGLTISFFVWLYILNWSTTFSWPLQLPFYLVTIWLAYKLIKLWLYESTITIENEALYLSGGVFVFRNKYTLHKNDIERFEIEAKEAVQAGENPEPKFKISVKLFTFYGITHIIAQHLKDEDQGQQLVTEIKKALGWQEDTPKVDYLELADADDPDAEKIHKKRQPYFNKAQVNLSSNPINQIGNFIGCLVGIIFMIVFVILFVSGILSEVDIEWSKEKSPSKTKKTYSKFGKNIGDRVGKFSLWDQNSVHAPFEMRRKNKKALLYFYSRGCKHCLGEIEKIAPLTKELSEQNAAVIGVSYMARELADEMKTKLAGVLLMDPTGEVCKKFGVGDFTVITINSAGIITYRGKFNKAEIFKNLKITKIPVKPEKPKTQEKQNK